ncbi:hypothetical protein DOTSEDRAFT_82322 [Dothistroma septosporum NZE10]|uniref:Uncharacterized protein n=1 Tax=Dothistroma septosporum (strain NZE10 / CBS 128990) TaxID=675120 RepID=N1PGW5_DOTSN|nr:hypothetical protein DOTSEDRAFT_82322 [Dothistroma septosporum NZE10]
MRQNSVLITGCTPGGIGYAVAKEFKARGLLVIATARSKAVVEELTADGLIAIQLDVTDTSSITACRQAVARLVDGKLDILMNNAGRGLSLPAIDSPLDQIRSVYETNVFAIMAMVNAFVDLLIPAQGLIINVSSITTLIPNVWGSVYASSKAAISSYSRTLRVELRPFGVRVQVIVAGAVKSNISDNTAKRTVLPADSLYRRALHLYERRKGFSQSKAAGSLPTNVFARKVVDKALASEMPLLWRNWFGRPDALYYGGMTRLLWWGSLLGDWVTDIGSWKAFRLFELQEIIERESRLTKHI